MLTQRDHGYKRGFAGSPPFLRHPLGSGFHRWASSVREVVRWQRQATYKLHFAEEMVSADNENLTFLVVAKKKKKVLKDPSLYR